MQKQRIRKKKSQIIKRNPNKQKALGWEITNSEASPSQRQ